MEQEKKPKLSDIVEDDEYMAYVEAKNIAAAEEATRINESRSDWDTLWENDNPPTTTSKKA